MGIDFLDVNFRIEQQFKIKITGDDLHSVIHQNDIRVGDLYDLILQKLDLQDNTRNNVGLNFFLWRQIQSTLADVTSCDIGAITLQTSMEELFPPEQRRDRWDTLQTSSPYDIRELDYSPRVRLIALALTLLVAWFEFANFRPFAFLQGIWPILGFIGLWMFVETYAKVLKLLAPWRNSIPAQLSTVKELCRDVLAKNYELVCQDADCNIELDKRCYAIWEDLVDILVDSLGVDADEITFQSRLVRDLDMA